VSTINELLSVGLSLAAAKTRDYMRPWSVSRPSFTKLHQ